MLVRARHQSSGFVLVALPLIAFAWATLWIWAQSPYDRYLHHGDWTQIGLVGGICRALPAGEVLLPGLLYVGGWVLMTAAMMLPTTLPLLEIVAKITAARPGGRMLLGLVIVGYLVVWSLFGLFAHLADLALHALVPQSPWLTFNGWALGAAVLALAGLFQFSALKRRCLDACRTPMSFVIQHWRGEHQRRQALLLGVHHGLYCVGCCWALMLLMFVVGTGSVGWMLALAAVMAAEKNLAWGRRLSAPLGIGLLAWSAWIVITETSALGL